MSTVIRRPAQPDRLLETKRADAASLGTEPTPSTRGDQEDIVSKNVRLTQQVLAASPAVIFSHTFRSTRPPIIAPADIQSGEKICRDRLESSVRRISNSKVLKYGVKVDLREAEAVCLLRDQAPSVSVPAVYNAYRIGDVSYIVMEYIPGPTVGECWNTLSVEEKNSVISQLQRHIASWRAIRGKYFGSVGGGACGDSIFKHSYTGDQIGYGPFASRREFNEGVVQALRNSRPNPSQYNLPLEKEIRDFQGPEMMVFTHGDLGPRNVIFNNGEVTILDWGEAGYSIEEREFVEAKWQASQNPDWERHITDFIPDFTSQYRFWNHVVNEMRLFSGV